MVGRNGPRPEFGSGNLGFGRITRCSEKARCRSLPAALKRQGIAWETSVSSPLCDVIGSGARLAEQISWCRSCSVLRPLGTAAGLDGGNHTIDGVVGEGLGQR
jgi:hypothetical protein